MNKVVTILSEYQFMKMGTANPASYVRARNEAARSKGIAEARLYLFKRRNAARQHRESDNQSTLSTQPPLPMIDAHCHLFGQSLAGTGPGLDMITGAADSMTSAARMGYLGMRPDRQNATLVLNQLEKFRRTEVDRKEAIAAVALQLDLCYTPLDAAALPDLTPNAILPGDMMYNTENDAAKNGVTDNVRYYRSDKHYLWINRDPKLLERSLEVFGAAAALYCGEVWPMAPFDPRRPNGLDVVKKAIDQWGYFGVKLYSRCGWMPYENARMYGDQKGAILDQRLDGLFDYCTTNDLPIVVHCSPTGFPPPGVLTLPAPFFADAYSTKGHNRYKMPNDTLGFPPDLVDPKSKPTTGAACARAAMTWMCNYCYYVQLSTSPYSWVPVFAKYPALRLDLAHSGGTLGVYAKYALQPDKARVWVHDSEENPFALGSTAGHLFEDYLKAGVKKLALQYMEAHLDPPKEWSRMGPVRAGFQVLLTGATLGTSEIYRQKRMDAVEKERPRMLAELNGELDKLFDPASPYGQWIAAWKQVYPVDWTTKVMELVSTHDNCYTDIAYISGDHPVDFKRILDNLLGGADQGVLRNSDRVNNGWARRVCTSEGRAMAYKNMAATDWFMTAMSKMEPIHFWQRIAKSVDTKTRLWDLLATDNTLRWMNVGRRFNGQGMDKLEAYYKDMWAPDPPPLPEWWDHLKKFYSSDRWSILRFSKPLPPIPQQGAAALQSHAHKPLPPIPKKNPPPLPPKPSKVGGASAPANPGQAKVPPPIPPKPPHLRRGK